MNVCVFVFYSQPFHLVSTLFSSYLSFLTLLGHILTLSLDYLFSLSPSLSIFSFSLSLCLGLSWQVQQRRNQLPCLCGTSASVCWCVQSGAVSLWGWIPALDMAVSWQFSPPLVSDNRVSGTRVCSQCMLYYVVVVAVVGGVCSYLSNQSYFLCLNLSHLTSESIEH